MMMMMIIIANDFDHDANDVDDNGRGSDSKGDDCNDHGDRCADYLDENPTLCCEIIYVALLSS